MLKVSNRVLLIAAVVATLSGCATGHKPVSVADTIASNAELSTLNSLIVKAGLTETLKGTGPYTVFAPTHAAFAKVPAKTMGELGSNPAMLKAVLSYHVIPAKLMAAEVKNANIKTVNGANVALSKAGEFVTIEDAIVEKADMAATNGVVHSIDGVLIPPAK